MNTAREDKALADALLNLINADAELSQVQASHERFGVKPGTTLAMVQACYDEAVAEYGAAVRDQARLAGREDNADRRDYFG